MKISKLTAILAVAFTLSAHAETAIKLPKSVVCQDPSDAKAPLKMYTRLDRVVSLEQLPAGDGGIQVLGPNSSATFPEDETAAMLADYHSISINKDLFTYFVFSCDSWDYTFTIRTGAMMEPASSTIKSKAVVVILDTEVRGEKEESIALNCTAQY